ncbi:MAG: recombinase family protein [Ktedonobacterales bacterium]|nr:recombinase family protein [Ktedonobacterales bacterium]
MPRSKQPAGKSEQRRWELPFGSRVWVYLRHSPGDNQTIGSQVDAMRQWCEINQWQIVREFVDEGIEGSKEEREQFQQMMTLARQLPRLVDGIVVWSFSRFARDQLDSQFYKADLRKHGFVVMSKIDDIPNNEVAPIIEAVVDWKNQRFLEDLSADIKRGQHYLVEHGYFPSGSVSIGYRFERVELGLKRNGEIRYANKLVKDESLSERVALAWKMKIEQNATFHQVHDATHLYERFKYYGVFFRNMIYSGVLNFAGKRYPSDWINGSRFCEPYITVEEFLKVQHNLHLHDIKHIAPRLLSTSYLLTGISWCGECASRGERSRVVGSVGNYRCLAKSEKGSKHCVLPRRRCHFVDDVVIDFFKQTVLTSEYLQAEYELARSSSVTSREQLTSQIQQLDQLSKDYEGQVKSLITLIAKKGMTPLLEKEYDHLNSLWNDAQSQLAELTKQAAIAYTQAIPKADFLGNLKEMQAIINGGPIESQRALFGRYIEAVYLYTDSVHVHLKFRQDDTNPAKRIVPIRF